MGFLLPWLENIKGNQANLILDHVVFLLIHIIMIQNGSEGKKIYSKGSKKVPLYIKREGWSDLEERLGIEL